MIIISIVSSAQKGCSGDGAQLRGRFSTWQKKKCWQKAPVLEHYDPTKKLSLPTDATDACISLYGVGALSHVLEDGTEKPIVYASSTLNPVEKRYSQLDKEGLNDFTNTCMAETSPLFRTTNRYSIY